MKRLLMLAPNWLGDAILALPAMADVRRGLPDTDIVVAARPSIAPLFALVADVDRTLVVDPKASLGTAAHQLAENEFEAALLLRNSMHAALLVRLAGIRERWGYRAYLRGPLLTRAIEPPSGLHQAGYY